MALATELQMLIWEKYPQYTTHKYSSMNVYTLLKQQCKLYSSMVFILGVLPLMNTNGVGFKHHKAQHLLT